MKPDSDDLFANDASEAGRTLLLVRRQKLEAMIAEATREIIMRELVYPKKVKRGEMRKEEMAMRIHNMTAIRTELEAVLQREFPE